MTAPPARPSETLRAPAIRLWTLAFAVALLVAGLGVVAGTPGPTTAGEDVARLPLGAEEAAAATPPGGPVAPQEAAGVSAEEEPADNAPAAAPPVEGVSQPPPPAPPAPPSPPALAPGEVERIPLVGVEPRLATFSGLSTWVDLYDTEISPESQARRAAAGGVQTIFVQTARFNSPADIHDPGRLARLIEAAHDLGLYVMTWYIPDHLNEVTDLRRAQAAIEFTTPRGDRPDAFGLDIEMESLPDIAERNQRLLRLSAALREWAGPDYPMAAIVLPPLQLDLRPSWWPAFPWAELRPYYDVFVPMSYSSFRGTDAGTTYNWNFRNIIETRLRTGDPNLPIHMAGGIADRLPAVDAYVEALRDGKVLGGGLYDLHTTPAQAWPRLRALRAE